LYQRSRQGSNGLTRQTDDLPSVDTLEPGNVFQKSFDLIRREAEAALSHGGGSGTGGQPESIRFIASDGLLLPQPEELAGSRQRQGNRHGQAI
jgi:hypothetical protein